MKRMLVALVGLALLGFAFPAIGWGAEPCPVELTKAKAALKNAQLALKKGSQKAKGQEVQAPRAQAGFRSQDVQAPRSQDVQAPRVKKASTLIRQAEAACKKGDMALSASKATEALALLKK